MALDNEDRAFLEKTIDRIVKEVPILVEMARQEVYQKYAHYKEADDFALGFATGAIYGGFIEYFVTKHQRQASEDEIVEGNQVILRRMREIKEAIFKCG